MSLNARKESGGGGDFVEQDLIEDGSYPGRLVQLIDMGMQPQRAFQGQEKPPVHQISTTYEFADEFMMDDDGEEIEDKPRWISETMPFYGLDVDRATSTKRYYALDPKEVFEGDWPSLVGMPCSIVVGSYVRKSGKNAGAPANCINGINVMRPKDAETCPELANPTKVFLLDSPDMEVFASLPDWMQSDIKGNLEYKGSLLESLIEGTPAPQANDQEDDDGWGEE